MMPKTRSRKIADLLSPASVAGTLSVDGGGGVATYTAIGDLPSSGLTAGDMAFVDSSDRLYIWAGSGWYNIALINRAPTIQSVLDSDGGSSPFTLSNVGATTTITILAQDSDGTPITYSAVADSDFNAMATVSQSSNVFTITPTAIQSSTGTITFKASDGINLASEISTFIITFIIANSRYTSLLVQSVGSNNGTNSTFTDASTNNLTLTAAGNPVTNTFSPYRAGGYSTYFDGAGDYIYTDNPLLNTEDFTIECWVFCKDGATDKGIWDCHTSSSSTDGLTLTRITDTTFRLWGTGQLVASSSITITDTWVHVAAVRISGTLTLFVNGISQGTASFSTNISNNNGFVIGGGRYSSSLTPVAYTNAYIRDFRIIKGTGVYTSNFTPATEPLTAITDTVLLTCQNNRFVDNSTFALAITEFGNTSVVPYGPYDYLPYDPVVNGGSVYFDGTGDYLTTSSTSPFNMGSGNFTIEGWIFATSTTSPQRIINNWDTTTVAAASWEILFAGGGRSLIFTASTGGTSNEVTLSTGAGGIVLGTWNHFAVVRNLNIFTLYVNGILKSNVSNAITLQAGNTFAIGSRRSGSSYIEPFNGYLSNLRVVKGTAVYTAAFTPPAAPVTAISGTSLLINGTDASIIDASQSTAVSLLGTTASSTTRIKYGNSSIKTSSPGNYVLTSNDAISFGADEDFTIEGWVNWLSVGGDQGIFQVIPNDQTFELGSQGSYPLMMMVWGGIGVGLNGGYTQGLWQGGANPTPNQWYHLAVSRSSGITKVFVDGVPVHTYGPASWATSGRLALGGYATTNHISNAYFQDWRYTKGLARYTTTFTPPAALLEG